MDKYITAVEVQSLNPSNLRKVWSHYVHKFYTWVKLSSNLKLDFGSSCVLTNDFWVEIFSLLFLKLN